VSRAQDGIPTDPLAWRPLRPLVTRVPVTVTDPIVEPLWTGTRVLHHFEAASSQPVCVIDGQGDDVTLALPEVVRQLVVAIEADDAVVDGVLTTEATRSGEGTAPIQESRSSTMGFLMSREATVEVLRKDKDLDHVVALVAVDLLRIDGEPLLDIPLLERKRLLEGVVVPSDRVRVSVYTRPPVDAWVASWKAAGLRGAMLKGANSRYVPGGYSADWRTVTQIAGRR
jgi:bifunctional non-homologous end joining protein LigD